MNFTSTTEHRCLECELSFAAGDGDLAALQAALQDGADPGSQSDCNTALFDAIERGHLEVLAALLDAGASLSRRHPMTQRTPLMQALEGEQLKVIQVLKSCGVDPQSASLASLVSSADRPELVHIALAGGIDLNTADPETGRTALHTAAIYGYLHTVKRLVEEGADPSVRDTWGNTPSTLAAQNHHEGVVKFLAYAKDQSE